jgi:type 1 glutamine amidotransferase
MTQTTSDDRLQVAVITGGHPFDVPSFHRLFRAMPGIDAYVQDFENFVHDWGKVRRSYDALVFYHFHQATPEGAFADAIAEIGETPQGVVVLHHAILAWLQWSLWAQICGAPDRTFGYYPEQEIRVDVANPNHPITQGISSWTMTDETYTMPDAGPDCDVLLTADHPKSMKTLAWTRQHRNARVFCFQSGHDDLTWRCPEFRETLARGIRWCAGVL